MTTLISSLSISNDILYTADSTVAPITTAGVTQVTIPTNGWVLRVDLSSSGGTIDPTKVTVSIKRGGYTLVGSTPTYNPLLWDDVAKGTELLRKPYPNQTADLQPATNSYYITLDNAIYGSDTIVSVDFAAGFYTGSASGQFLTASVTRNDNRAYPKPVVQSVAIPYERKTGTTSTFEVTGTHEFARDAKPFGVVEAWIRTGTTDGTHAFSTTMANSSFTSGTTASGLKVSTYSVTVPHAGVPDGLGEYRYKVYPQCGDVIFDSTDAADASAYPTADPFAGVPVILDTANKFFPIYAYVNQDPVAQGGTTITNSTAVGSISTSPTDPTVANSFATMYDACRAACNWNNTSGNRPAGSYNNTDGLIILLRDVAGSVLGSNTGAYAIRSSMRGTGVTAGNMPVEIRAASGVTSDLVRIRSVLPDGSAPTSKVVPIRTRWKNITFDTTGLSAVAANCIVIDGSTSISSLLSPPTNVQTTVFDSCKLRGITVTSGGTALYRMGLAFHVNCDFFEPSGNNCGGWVGTATGGQGSGHHLSMSIGSRYEDGGGNTAFPRCLLAFWGVGSQRISHSHSSSYATGAQSPKFKTALLMNVRVDCDSFKNNTNVPVNIAASDLDNLGIVNLLIRKARSASYSRGTEVGALAIVHDQNKYPLQNAVIRYVSIDDDDNHTGRFNFAYNDSGPQPTYKRVSCMYSAFGAINTKADEFNASYSAASQGVAQTVVGWRYWQGEIVHDNGAVGSRVYYICKQAYSGLTTTDYASAGTTAGGSNDYWICLGTSTASWFTQTLRVGNWFNRYMVRNHYNVTTGGSNGSFGFDPDSWIGEVEGRSTKIGTLSTYYVNSTSGDKAGLSAAGFQTWGDYTPSETGPLVAAATRVPLGFAAAPTDLYGNPRLNNGQGAIGAVERVVASDTTPNSFSFSDQNAVAVSTVITSNAVTISGIDAAATVTVTGGEYQIDSAGSWFTTSGTVTDGQTIRVRHTSSASPSTATNTVLTVGGVSDTFTSTTAASDTTPNPFSFSDQNPVALSSTITSNTITVSGIDAATPISITGGTYSKNSGAYTSTSGTVVNGDTVTVRHTSSASFSTSTDTVLTIGGVSDTFTSTTLAADTTPNAFSFTDVPNVALSSVQTSNSITVSGINTSTAISVTGGTYSVNSGSYVSTSGTVVNGDTVTVRHTASASNSTATNTTLTIGGVSDTFTSTTVGASDTTPDAFSFTSASNVALSSVQTSNSITVSGIDAPASISVSGGTYSINGGAYVSTSGTVSNGNTVTVRHTSSASFSTGTTTTLTIGGVSGGFTSTTLAADTTPDAFSFPSKAGVALSTLTASDTVTITGLTSGASISVSNGSYQINGGSWVTASGTITNGQTVAVRHTSSGSYSTTVTTTLTIGGVSGSFSTTTITDPSSTRVYEPFQPVRQPNVLIEVNPLSGGTPVAVKMSKAGIPSAGSILNGAEWKPVITSGPQASFSTFDVTNGVTSPFGAEWGPISFVIDPKLGNHGWSNYSWEGATAKIYLGYVGDTFASYRQIFEGSVGPLQRNGQTARLALLGPDATLNVPLLTVTYGGTGGLEGPAGLKGNLKPWCSGACQNIEPVWVDTVNMVYQVHGYGAVNAITDIYENALDFGPAQADVASYAALVGLSLAKGQWATCKAQGLFRLGSEPKGKITADVEGALDTGVYQFTLGGIAKHLLTWSGVPPAKLDTASLAAFSQPWRTYITDQKTVGEIVREAFFSAGGYLRPSVAGVWGAGNYFASTTPLSIKAGELITNPVQLATAQPAYRVKIGADRCFSTHSDNEISSVYIDLAQDGVVGFLTNESHTLAATSAGVVSDFSGATGTFKMFEGLTDITTGKGVVYAAGTQTGCVATIDPSTGVYSVSAMSADNATAIFTASYGTAAHAKTLSLSKSKSGSVLSLGAVYQTITYDGLGAANPSTQTNTFTVTRQGTAASVSWAVYDLNNNLRTPLSTYLTVAGDTLSATMTETMFAAGRNGTNGLKVVASIAAESLSDTITVSRVRDGTAGTNGTSPILAILDNETHVVPADSGGNVASYAGAGGQMRVYLGTTEVTGSSSFSVFSETGVDVSINSSGVYSVASMSADSGTAVLRAQYLGTNYDRTYSIAKSKAGAGGAGSVLIRLTSTHQTFPYDGAGTIKAQTTTLTAARQNTSETTQWQVKKLDGTVIKTWDTAANLVSATIASSSANNDTIVFDHSRFATLLASNSTTGLIIETRLNVSTSVVDRITIIKIADGANGTNGTNGTNALVGYLTNESHTVPADSAGNVTSYSGAEGFFKVFSGTTDVTTGCTFSYGTYAPADLAASMQGAGGSFGQANGYYRLTYLSTDTGFVDYVATHTASGQVVTKRFTVAKSKAGTSGTNGTNGTNGSNGANAKLIALLSDRQTIAYDSAGSPSPPTQTTTFITNRQNLTTGVTWSLTDINGTPISTGYLSIAGDSFSATMTEANFNIARNGTTGVIVTAAGVADGVSDKISVVRLQNGTNGTNGTNGSNGVSALDVSASPNPIAVACTYAGSPKAAIPSFMVSVRQAGATVTGSASYSITTSGLTGVSGGSGVGASTVSVTGMSADTGSAVVTASYGGATQTVTVNYTKVKDAQPFVSGTDTTINTPSTGYSTVGQITLVVGPNGTASLDYDVYFLTGSDASFVQSYLTYNTGSGDTVIAGNSTKDNNIPSFDGGNVYDFCNQALSVGANTSVTFKLWMKRTGSVTQNYGTMNVQWNG